jgi:hypothetical protein
VIQIENKDRIICPECGEANRSKATFCSKCGKKISGIYFSAIYKLFIAGLLLLGKLFLIINAALLLLVSVSMIYFAAAPYFFGFYIFNDAGRDVILYPYNINYAGCDKDWRTVVKIPPGITIKNQATKRFSRYGNFIVSAQNEYLNYHISLDYYSNHNFIIGKNGFLNEIESVKNKNAGIEKNQSWLKFEILKELKDFSVDCYGTSL